MRTEVADVELLYKLILTAYSLIFFYLNFNGFRSLALKMADSMTAPQTPNPRRTLFKPSSKTPPVKRSRKSSTSTPQSAQQPNPDASSRPAEESAPKSRPETPKPSNPKSSSKSSSKSSQAPKALSSKSPALDDVAQSTTLAPLTDKADVESGNLGEFAGSDGSGLVDDNVSTSNDTLNRSTDATKENSKDAPVTPTRKPRRSTVQRKDPVHDEADEQADSAVGSTHKDQDQQAAPKTTAPKKVKEASTDAAPDSAPKKTAPKKKSRSSTLSQDTPPKKQDTASKHDDDASSISGSSEPPPTGQRRDSGIALENTSKAEGKAKKTAPKDSGATDAADKHTSLVKNKNHPTKDDPSKSASEALDGSRDAAPKNSTEDSENTKAAPKKRKSTNAPKPSSKATETAQDAAPKEAAPASGPSDATKAVKDSAPKKAPKPASRKASQSVEKAGDSAPKQPDTADTKHNLPKQDSTSAPKKASKSTDSAQDSAPTKTSKAIEGAQDSAPSAPKKASKTVDGASDSAPSAPKKASKTVDGDGANDSVTKESGSSDIKDSLPKHDATSTPKKVSKPADSARDSAQKTASKTVDGASDSTSKESGKSDTKDASPKPDAASTPKKTSKANNASKDPSQKDSAASDNVNDSALFKKEAPKSTKAPKTPSKDTDSASQDSVPQGSTKDEAPKSQTKPQKSVDLPNGTKDASSKASGVADSAGQKAPKENGEAPAKKQPEPTKQSKNPALSKKSSKPAPNGTQEAPDAAKDSGEEIPEAVKDLAKQLPGGDSDEVDRIDLPEDLVKHFAKLGHPEMGEFVKALIAQAPEQSDSTIQDAMDTGKDTASGAVDGFDGISRDLMNALPKDDELVAETNGKADEVTGQAKSKASDTQKKGQDSTGDVPKKVDGVNGHANGVAKGASQNAQDDKKVAENEASNLKNESNDKTSTEAAAPRQLQPAGDKAKDTQSEATDKASGASRDAQAPNGDHEDREPGQDQLYNLSNGHEQNGNQDGAHSQSVDNYGRPARINKQVNIPLPIPERLHASRQGSNTGADGQPNGDESQDPPEEFLDPFIHSPLASTANIDPIPKIQKIKPIGSQPPPNLADLAKGLVGMTVDDVANVVDESGKVLGHATGDLPSLIGRKIAENGEIYGDNGELIGYVTENFTAEAPQPPQPASRPSTTTTPLPGNLQVDMEGNIMDSNGNIIGKLNNQPSSLSGALVPSDQTSNKNQGPREESKQQEKSEDSKPKTDDNGIPADIFLDVKSTSDGIQLTIRIPTVFRQEKKFNEGKEEHKQV